MKEGNDKELQEFYWKTNIEKDSKIKKEEFLYRIMSIIEILPVYECQRICDYLSELYLS
jgi:hypothetical protein